jgi:predicted DNA-binding transcriptional regulator AlpA
MTTTRARRGRPADYGPVPRPELAARATSRRNHVATSQQPSSSSPSADEWLTVEEICTELKISRRTFDRWRARGTGPRCEPLGGHGPLRTRRSWLDAWAENGPDAA